jgi:hypothetical protein
MLDLDEDLASAGRMSNPDCSVSNPQCAVKYFAKYHAEKEIIFT